MSVHVSNYLVSLCTRSSSWFVLYRQKKQQGERGEQDEASFVSSAVAITVFIFKHAVILKMAHVLFVTTVPWNTEPILIHFCAIAENTANSLPLCVCVSVHIYLYMCVLKTITALHEKSDPLASWCNVWIIFRPRQHCQLPLLVPKDWRWWGLPFWVRGFGWVKTEDCAYHYGPLSKPFFPFYQ